ncbi:hypothetical protein RFI_18956, partial [Reticulomyxa filosa]
DVVYFGNVVNSSSSSSSATITTTTTTTTTTTIPSESSSAKTVMTSNRYHMDLFLQKNFAQVLHDNIDPIRYWTRTNPKYRSRTISPPPSHVRDALEDGMEPSITHNDLLAANFPLSYSATFRDRPYICFETSEGLLPNMTSRAARDWQNRTQFLQLTIQNKATASPPQVILKVTKPYQLHTLFEEVRKQLQINPSQDLRVWQVRDSTPFLVDPPHAFRDDADLILEADRYAHPDERLLCISIADENTFVQSDFIAFIFKDRTSAKQIKQRVLQHFKRAPEEYKEWILYNITCDTKDRFFHDDCNLGDNKFRCSNGERFLLEKGMAPVKKIQKNIYAITDVRDLSSPFMNLDRALGMDVNGTSTVYCSEKVAVLDTEIDIGYDDLRKKIHSLDQFKNNVTSYEHLLLSWYDDLLQRPLSYPCLHSGKLKGQLMKRLFVFTQIIFFYNTIKRWNIWESDKTVLLAVEVLPEPLPHISKFALFLHVFLARPKVQEPSPNVGNTANSGSSGTTTITTTSDNVELEFWPPDGHIRVLYDEGEEKITWRRLREYLARRFNLKTEHTYGALFKIMRREWMELKDSHDEQNKALDGAPWNIKGPSRDAEVIAIFESSEYPSYFKNMNKWSSPPLSAKSKLVASTNYYDSGAYSSLSESSKHRHEQQLRIEVED